MDILVAQKKRLLGRLLTGPMEWLADKASPVWPDADALDQVLAQGFMTLHYCHLLYALDREGRQLSSNVAPADVGREWRGQDLSGRPYLAGSLPFRGFVLSRAYLSTRSLMPCITAVQAVRGDDLLAGFIAADFNIADLPDTGPTELPAPDWRQFRGDPAIRDSLFLQERVHSVLDERMGPALSILESLMRRHGIFHAKVHFSSSRVTLWHVEDAFNYRLHTGEELAAPEICLTYKQRSYPPQARVASERIRPVLERFRALRQADENIYLRSASINVINGMVGLTFSCDGSHYMTADEFLARDLGFWLGGAERSLGASNV